MTVALLFISDGRDEYMARTLASVAANLPPVDLQIHVDDRGHKLGFAGAIAEGWQRILRTQAEWVVHLEADFTFNETVDLAGMIALLERHPHLAQVALKRQPWNEEEKAAGGIVELHTDDFTEYQDKQAIWTEHRRFFTTNPSVYSTRLCRLGWPMEKHSEGVFTHRLIADPMLSFAFWGAKFDPPRVEHIGNGRAGHGY